MGILDMIDRWRVRRSFAKYVSPGVIKLIEANPAKFITGPEMKHFQFVVVNVDVDNMSPDEFRAVISRVSESFHEHNAILEGITNTLITGWMGSPFPQYDTPDGRLALIASLHAANGQSIRIAHGQCTGLMGNFGGPRRSHFGVMIPGFPDLLKKLLDAPFGTAIEIPGK
jgi:hypothetical protein